MNWSELSHPRHAFGEKDKEYKFGGDISRNMLDQILTPNELDMLKIVVQLLFTSVILENSDLHCMLVGSSLTETYFDLDMICCTDPPNHRDKVVNSMSRLSNGYFMDINLRTTNNKLLTKHKIFMHRNFVYFDISFAGIDSGTWQDVKEFHERTQLSHCVLL